MTTKIRWISFALFLIGNLGVSQAETPGRDVPTDSPVLAGKWTYSATATCRCVDDSCRTISCSGETGVSYEDAKLKATLALQAEAKLYNGRIEGTPSFTIKFESKFEGVDSGFDLTVFNYTIFYYNKGAVVHRENWSTVAQDGNYAAAYASNHSLVVTQQLRERGIETDRTSAQVTSTSPYPKN